MSTRLAYPVPETRHIPLDQIVEPPAPLRASMDEGKLIELRDSIRAIGLLQAIIVVAVSDGQREREAVSAHGNPSTSSPAVNRYEIVAGHRRYLAARLVPLSTIECKVYEDSWDAKEAAMLAENAFREDVTAAEEGWKYCELVEKYTLTEAQLCAMVQQSPEYIYARMDLVKTDADVAKLVAERKISFSVGRELLKCKDKEHRGYLAGMAADAGCSMKVARMWVQQWQSQQQSSIPATASTTAPDTGSAPVENTLKCWCCGESKDPQNLRLIYLHWYELDSLARILREAGLKPGEGAPPQQAA